LDRKEPGVRHLPVDDDGKGERGLGQKQIEVAKRIGGERGSWHNDDPSATAGPAGGLVEQDGTIWRVAGTFPPHIEKLH
jgi:hypothetical protein